MNRIFGLLVLIVACSTAQAQNPAASICTFKNDARGAYNLIHDDFGDMGVIGINNFADTMAFNRGIKITFGAITSSCEGNPGMYAKANEMIYDHEHEIINHSHTHSCAVTNSACGGTGVNFGWAVPGSTQRLNIEVDQSTQSILTNTGIRPRYFIYPYDQFNSEADAHLQNNGYIGSRTGAYNAAAANTLAPNAAGFFRTPLVVDVVNVNGEWVAQNLNFWVDQAINNQQWVNRELHNVGPTGWGRVGVTDYRNHLNYVKTKMNTGELWVGTVSEILTYQIQKLNYTPTTSWNNTSKVITVNWNNPSFNVANYLAPLYYKSPITLKVDVSNAVHAGNYQISQNSVAITDFQKVGNFLLVNVYPHQGPVQIQVTNCATLCINTQPSGTSVTEGTTLSLSVLATGQNPITYQWFRAGLPLTGQTAATLSIPNVQLSDAGAYTVRVTNGTGSLTSAQAVVTVIANPCLRLCVSAQPQAQGVDVGSPINLSITAQGVLPITYQWNLNGNPISGANSASYTISAAALANTGNYSVTLTNSTGTVTSNTALVQVFNQTPYAGVIPIPGIVQAENFDNGGQGVAYNELTTANQGNATSYRTTEVDVESNTDGGAGFNVGYISDGEWLEYTVNVAGSGNYNFVFRTASVNSGSGNGAMRVEMNGTTVATVASIPYTASWTTFTNTTINNVALAAGQQTMRFFFTRGNFNLNFVNITPVSPIVPTIVATNQTRTYGDASFGLTATSNSSGAITYSLVSATPSGMITLNAAGNVGITASGTATILVSQAASGSFGAGSATMTLTVNKKALQLSAEAKTKIYGAANPALTFAASGFANGDDLNDLSAPPVLSTTATASSVVGEYPITISGGAAANYTFSYLANNLTINPRALTITAQNTSKVYGAANPTFTFSASGFVNGDNSSVLNPQPVLNSSATVSSAVGIYPISVSGAVNPNYTISYTAGQLTISPKSIVITADSKSKIYRNANPTLTYTVSGLVNGETAAVLNPQPAISTTANTNSNVGTYPISISGAANSNYSITYEAATLTVNPRALTLSANAISKTYGEANPTLTFTASGLANGESASILSPQPVLSTSATNLSGVGTYPISISGAGAANYTITYQAGNLTVNPKALILTAESKSKTYGSANPALTFVANGFVNGQNNSVLSPAPTLSTTATATSGVGLYPITISGATALNYTITYQAATLTINPKALTLTADAKSKVYGSNNPALTFTASGFVNGDNVNVFNPSPTLSTTANVASGVGTYPISISAPAAANYAITFQGANLTVNPKALTLSVDAKSKVYGAANPALTYTANGFVNGDNVTIFNPAPTLSTTATSASGVGLYPILISNAVASNYSIAYQAASLTVNPKALTLSVDAKSKVYGAANPALTYTANGLVNGDNVNVLNPAPSLNTNATDASVVGVYPITISGASSPNYSIAYANGVLTVEKASLTISANDFIRAEGEDNPEFTLLYVGLVNGDLEQNMNPKPVMTTTATSTSPAGKYGIEMNCVDYANYQVTCQPGTLTISSTSSTSNGAANRTFTVYPNPTEGQLFLPYEMTGANLQIWDALGALVFEQNNTSERLEVNQLPEGLYTIKLIDQEGNYWNTSFIKN